MQTYNKFANCPQITPEEVAAALGIAAVQTESCLPKFSSQFKSIFSTNGFYETAPNEQWTNGFWTGELWLMWEHTKNPAFLEAATAQVESFLHRIENGINTDTHDLGFLYSLSCVAGYKLTGSATAKKAALLAADGLLARFHEKGQFIQAWGSLENKENYRLIIDCLLNLPLLYWASEETGDAKYAEKARAHVKTALNVLVREDSSAYHTFYFDPETGEPTHGETHQGYSADSAWARGQAWGIYGIALSYRYTKNPEYITLFERVSDYFLSHLPDNMIPLWDFIFPEGSDEPWDSSASAIAVCGMLEMAKYLPREKAEYYTDMAKKMQRALVELCAAKSPKQSSGQLLHGVYGIKTPHNDCIDHGVDECNLWGDYYYLEALTRLNSDWKPYW